MSLRVAEEVERRCFCGASARYLVYEIEGRVFHQEIRGSDGIADVVQIVQTGKFCYGIKRRATTQFGAHRVAGLLKREKWIGQESLFLHVRGHRIQTGFKFPN